MKTRLTVAALFCSLTFSVLRATILTGPVTNSANDHVYYLLTSGSWSDSEKEAITLGGHIVTISDSAENEWVYSNFANFDSVSRNLWIGFYRTNSGFAWSSGETVAFTHWATGEPNNCDLIENRGVILGANFPAVESFWADINESGTGGCGGGDLTPNAVVELDGPPFIVAQPTNTTVLAGANVTFSVVAGGAQPLRYQWRKDGSSIPNATNSTFALSNVQPSAAGTYSVSISNYVGSVASSDAVLEVNLLAILSGPVTNSANNHVYYLLASNSWSVSEATAISLRGHIVTISDLGENQWVYTNFANFGNAPRNLWIGLYRTNNSFAWASGEPAGFTHWAPGEPNNCNSFENRGVILGTNFSTVASFWADINESGVGGCGGGDLTPNAVVELDSPPFIITQPTNISVSAGSNVTFNVLAGGAQPLTYQWRKDSSKVASATNATLVLSNVQPSSGGTYSVLVSNSLGFVASSNAVLQVKVLYAYGNNVPLTNSPFSFSVSATIKLVNVYPGGLTFYTLDGSAPSFASMQYTGQFVLTNNAILRAIGYPADFFESGELDPVTILVVPNYTLSATTGGGGSVTLNPTGGSYLSNSVVTVTASPSAGWTFLQWLGDLAGTNSPANITVDRNKKVQAIFGTTLGTTAAGGGAVTLDPPGGLYPYGSNVTLIAVPQSGNYFGLWGNAASGNQNPLYFTVTNANPTVSSLFAALNAGQFALTVIPSGFGRVTVSPRANAYSSNATVTLTATADAGQDFLGWSGDASGTANPLGITMNQSKTITANFTRRALLTTTTTLDGLVGGGFRFSLIGEFNRVYQVETSTNCVNWSPLATITNLYGKAQYFDAPASAQARFYRVLPLP